MDTGMLHLHSFLRWVILIFLVLSIFQSLFKWRQKSPFTKSDAVMFLITMISAHINLLIGLYQLLFGRFGIFSKSLPPGASIHEKFFRFYWIEHPFGMIVSIVLITLGAGMRKKAVPDTTKFRKAFLFFFFALVIILATIPWPSMQTVGRPLMP